MSLAVFDHLLSDIANRCCINDSKTLRKSKELMVLLNSMQQLNCPESCKVAICLELASNLTACGLDRDEIIKYSGCKKKMYANMYNNISKLLNLDKVYSVKEVCLIMGASEIHSIAVKLYEEYKCCNEELKEDMDHPMYTCAAVLAICRSNKIKINFSKLVEISRVKKTELEALLPQFQKLLEPTNEGTKNKKRANNIVEMTAQKVVEVEERPKRKKESDQMSESQYNEWKRKMLED